APLMRWRKQDPQALMRTALPSVIVAAVVALGAVILGVRQPLSAAIVFGAAWALAANAVVTLRGFRAGWKHGIADLGHLGVAVMLIGIVASSQYGREVQVQLPEGQARNALGYRLTFEGVRKEQNGKNRVAIAVNAEGRQFEALPAMYWSEFNQGYMKKPHIERFLTHDIYISPREMVGNDPAADALWLAKGESRPGGPVEVPLVEI